jgi:hypothetical protein
MDQRRRTLIIPFMGGLGNQLFQYAAGVYMRKIMQRNPKYSLRGFSSSKNTPRSFMLGDLLNENDKATHGRLGLAFFKLLSFVIPSVWVAEKSLNDFPLERVSKGSIVLLGYFQRHKYVDAVSTDLIKSLSQSNVFSPLFSSPANNDIAVHIRFGDYLANLETRIFHGLSAMSYYVEAVRFLQSSHNYDKIVIYSDNQEKAFADFTYEYGLGGLPVSASTGTSEYDDLAKISSSKGIVISNSTFSWWAAWIGTQLHECNVVAPKPWFAIPTAADDNLLPVGWTVLNRVLQP